MLAVVIGARPSSATIRCMVFLILWWIVSNNRKMPANGVGICMGVILGLWFNRVCLRFLGASRLTVRGVFCCAGGVRGGDCERGGGLTGRTRITPGRSRNSTEPSDIWQQEFEFGKLLRSRTRKRSTNDIRSQQTVTKCPVKHCFATEVLLHQPDAIRRRISGRRTSNPNIDQSRRFPNNSGKAFQERLLTRSLLIQRRQRPHLNEKVPLGWIVLL